MSGQISPLTYEMIYKMGLAFEEAFGGTGEYGVEMSKWYDELVTSAGVGYSEWCKEPPV